MYILCRPDIHKRWRLNSSNEARRGLGPYLSLSMLGELRYLSGVLGHPPQTQIWKQVEDQVHSSWQNTRGPSPSPPLLPRWPHPLSHAILQPGPHAQRSLNSPQPWPPPKCSTPRGLFYASSSVCNTILSSVCLAKPYTFPKTLHSIPATLPNRFLPGLCKAFIMSPTPNYPLPYYSMFLPSILHNQRFSYILIYWLLSVSSQLESKLHKSYSPCSTTPTSAWKIIDAL